MIPKYNRMKARSPSRKMPMSSPINAPVFIVSFASYKHTLEDEASEFGYHVDNNPIALVKHELLIIELERESLRTD